MVRLSAVILTALSFVVPLVGYAQTSSSDQGWFTLNAQEGQTVTATGSITMRFGQLASTCAIIYSPGPCSAGSGTPTPEAWTAPQTFTAASSTATVSIVIGAAAFGNVDPLPGVYKTVQVQESSTPQTITVNGQQVTVPALSTSSPPTTTSDQGWYTLNAQEGQTVTATGSITMRFGQVASTCAISTSSGPCTADSGSPSPEAWTAPQTFTATSSTATVSIVIGAAAFGNVDPLPGVYKTVQVQELSTPQNITVNGQAVTVPALSSSSGSASDQGWFTVNAQEGQTVTATGSITMRFGQLASTCAVTEPGPCSSGSGTPSPEAWTAPKTFTATSSTATVSIVIGAAAFGNVDPLPGVYKTVQVQELSTAQNITVSGQVVTVPALSSTSVCQLTATPTSISFPNTTVGYSYNSTASIVNNCSTTIAVNSVQTTGPYSASGYSTPFSLAAGQTQNYTAVFTPTTTGTASGSITFISNASTGQTVSVSLSGTGVASAQGLLSPSTTSVSFGNVTVNNSQSQTVTITNTGSASATISAVAVSGTGFSLGSMTTPFTLAANQSTQITVTFSPTSSGAAAGTLSITSDAQNSSLTVQLSGTGTHYVALSWQQSSTQVAGYNIYRSTVSGGSYSKINSSLVTTTNYADTTVAAGKTYYYAATAVGTNGVESAYSNQTTAVVPSP